MIFAFDAAVLGRKFQRIRQVVVEHLLEAAGVEKDRAELAIQILANLNLLLRCDAGETVDDFTNERCGVMLFGVPEHKDAIGSDNSRPISHAFS